MTSNVDSINWPPEFAELKRLDVILKCGICYDFMNSCMITSCSHTYCSLCIRKFMQYKNQCPICYEETYEINLRNNRLLDEVISIYTKIRDKLLRASRLASVTAPIKHDPIEKKTEPEEKSSTISKMVTSMDDEKTPKKENAINETIKNPPELKLISKLSVVDGESVIINGVKVPGMFTSPKMSSVRPRRPEELTSCPVCNVNVPAKNINIHLDSCLALDPANKPKLKVKKRSPLPKRVYTMMPEKILKKFLKEYGLSTSGDRKTLIHRLQRYTVIYNAENDSANPRSVSELIKQLEREEREEKKSTSSKNLISQPRQNSFKKDIESVEKANKAYCEENKNSFKKLIEEMRAREGKNIKPLKPTCRIYSDDDDDPNRDVIPIVHNPELPSTSYSNNTVEDYSSSSRAKRSDSRTNISGQSSVDCDRSSDDSDEEIYMASDTDDSVAGKIDWNKTKLADDENDTPDSIYDLPTQKPIDKVNLISDDDGDEKEDKDKDRDEEMKSVVVDNDNNSMSTDYGDSDNSIFADVPRQNSNKKLPTNTRKNLRRRLSLSWKKPVEQDEIRGGEDTSEEGATDLDCTQSSANNDCKIVSNINENSDKENIPLATTITDPEDEDEFNDFERVTKIDEITEESINNTDDNVDVESREIIDDTPLRRITRNAKRKSISNHEIQDAGDVDETVPSTPVSRKKTKRDTQGTTP